LGLVKIKKPTKNPMRDGKKEAGCVNLELKSEIKTEKKKRKNSFKIKKKRRKQKKMHSKGNLGVFLLTCPTSS